MSATGVVFDIKQFSLHDGPGIRTTVFLKGCVLRCWWCHNPESQSSEAEVSFLRGRCTRCGQCRAVCPQGGPPEMADGKAGAIVCIRCGACVERCPSQARQMVGRRITAGDVVGEAMKDRIFYDDSGGGVTFSGGEPLAQPQFLAELLRACRARGLHTAVDTCGFAPRRDLLAIAALADLFLYDLKALDPHRHRQGVGQSNALIVENLQALGRVHGNVWVRVPVVPGFNDDPGELNAIVGFAASVAGVRQINLLPFHKAGFHKSAGLGRPDSLPAMPCCSAGALERTAEALRTHGVPIKVGG